MSSRRKEQAFTGEHKCAGSRLAIKSGKKIENASFTLKTNQMFSVQTTPEKF